MNTQPNLQRVIRDLERTGLNQCEIARRTGLTQENVNMLSTGVRGKRPTYATASVLLDLWDKVVGKRKRVRARS